MSTTVMKKNFYFAVLWLLVGLSSSAQTNDRPNILIIYADDLGYGDLSCYGGDIPTPNIDRIGNEGIRFTDFYVASPVCTPSRFALLTGTYPHKSRHQLITALMPFDKNHLAKTEVTLAEYLKVKDYNTALIGKWHLGSEDKDDMPVNHGFDKFSGIKGGCVDYFYHTYGKLGPDWYVDGQLVEEDGYSTHLITDHAIEYVKEAGQDSNPFFLYLAYNAPHYGKSDPDSLPGGTIILQEAKYGGYAVANTLQVPQEYMHKFSHIKDPYRRAYAAMVSNLDDNVGRLLRVLDAEGLSGNTMIWFISDNGGSSQSLHAHASNGDLRGEKGTLWEGGIRVPALMSWKNKISGSQTVATPVCNIDLVPTLASIVGFTDDLAHSVVDGIDISKVLFDGASLERDIIWEFRQQTAIRSGDWKLVNDRGTTKLYNLKLDMSERNDVALKYRRKVNELQERFRSIR